MGSTAVTLVVISFPFGTLLGGSSTRLMAGSCDRRLGLFSSMNLRVRRLLMGIPPTSGASPVARHDPWRVGRHKHRTAGERSSNFTPAADRIRVAFFDHQPPSRSRPTTGHLNTIGAIPGLAGDQRKDQERRSACRLDCCISPSIDQRCGCLVSGSGYYQNPKVGHVVVQCYYSISVFLVR
jgi:hypothetical protein